MSRFNTGNPLGSGDPRDLDDNAKNMDLAVNAEADTFQDRLGRSRLTWAGVVKAGTGDPAIAVDAAARAEAAASSVEQNAEQIAQDAAQQAVDSVVIAVDGAVDRAENAADRAEAASNAAFASGNLFDTTADGLAAVADGQLFFVSTADPQVFDIYLNDAGTAVASGQFKVPDGSEALAVVRAEQASVQLPNLLPEAEILSIIPPTANGSTISSVVVDGIPASRVVATADAPRCYWQVPASEFESGLISAYVMILSATSGTGGQVAVRQRTGLSIISETVIETGLAGAITEPTPFQIGGVPLNPEATRVDLDVTLRGAGREFVVQFPMLADGAIPGFRHADQRKEVATLREFTQEVTNASPFEYPLPLNIQTAGGPVAVSPLKESINVAGALRAVSTSGASSIWAARVGSMLASNDVVRVAFTAETIHTSNPAFGILFGTQSGLRGFALRNTAQLLTLDLPSNVTGNLTGPTARPFSQGDTLVMDARVVGGSPGNYTVRYFVEYEDGERAGPYDVGGIGSIDEVWIGGRSSNTWTNVEVARFGPSMYLEEFVGGGGGVIPSGVNIAYVATDGNDDNDGSPGAPFRTISKAIERLPDGGVIEVSGGEYRETVVVGSKGYVWIRSKVGERAKILGSEQLAVTKTPGYSQVYQAPLADKPVGMGGNRGKPAIFEWGTPSKPISPDSRHPMHRGKLYRLPYTEMHEADSLAELDTPAGLGKWWWDDGVIYFTATDGSDASLKRYEARARTTFQHFSGSVRLSRLDILFSNTRGVQLGGHSAITDDVTVLGSYSDGFQHRAGTWVSRRDRSGGNGNDGFNGTVTSYSSADDGDTRITGIFTDPWGHDNGDDGTSYHNRGDQSIFGGLFEYNTKADVVHVTGASVTCYGTETRGTTRGFYAADAPTGDVAREYTALRCVGTKASDHDYCYRATDGAVLLCDDALALNPSISGYSQSGTGSLVATDCRYIGESGKDKQGAITVISSTQLS